MQAELYWVPCPLLGRMAIMPRPRGGDWLADELYSLTQAGIDVLVSCLTSWEVSELDLREEPIAAERAGIQFINFPIVDRGVPPDAGRVADLTAALSERLSGGGAVAIHCRAGVGRAAVVAACLLITCGLEPEAAFTEIAAARGLAVPDTLEQRAFVEDFARTRIPRRLWGSGQVS